MRSPTPANEGPRLPSPCEPWQPAHWVRNTKAPWLSSGRRVSGGGAAVVANGGPALAFGAVAAGPLAEQPAAAAAQPTAAHAMTDPMARVDLQDMSPR